MANYALLTANGRDRPGIVAAMAGVVLDCECNIEDSQMARLGPEFACMLVLRLPEGLLSTQLEQRLTKVTADMGLRMFFQDLSPEEASETRPDHPKHVIHVYGADRKGIVHRITERLAAQSVNITNLQTEIIHHQTPLYVMMIEVEVPSFLDPEKLQAELAAIGQEIQVVVFMKSKEETQA